MFKIFPLFFFFVIPYHLWSQILPKEGSAFNYRLIGFSFLSGFDANSYKIEIALGNFNSISSFSKNIIRSYSTVTNKIIAEVPFFGSQYTWRVVSYFKDKNNAMESSSLYHFDTKMSNSVDTNKERLRIVQPTDGQLNDEYVTIESEGVLYDMSGHPVWFLPIKNGDNKKPSDIKFTPQSTITFTYGSNGYEIDFNGDVLWKTPNKGIISGDTIKGEEYHHEFTKLSNGHYMILGTQIVYCKLVSSKDSSYIITSQENKEQSGFSIGKFGTIIEYNEKGDIVWSWKSSKYLIGSDFDYYESIKDTNKLFDPHDNAFFFDEKNSVIYLGFKGLSRIIKIEYPSGKVLKIYGENFKPGTLQIGKGLFCNQHSISISRDGYLYYFNNNSCHNTEAVPTIVMLREPVSANDTLKKVWEYQCPVENDAPKRFGQGGNVIELPDRSMFVCMGRVYNKFFIVNREKDILWSAFTEHYIETEKKWTPTHEYRANMISRKELESMIWNAESSIQSSGTALFDNDNR